MSEKELIQITISENIREIAREVVRLHKERQGQLARQSAREHLPWHYDYVQAQAFFSTFMACRQKTIAVLGGAFSPEDLATIAMMEAEQYLHGSWGHAVAVAEDTDHTGLWQHAAFRASAAIYGQRCISDLIRREFHERRSDRKPETAAGATDSEANEQPPRDYQFVVRNFSSIARRGAEDDDLGIDFEDESAFEEELSVLREFSRVDAEKTVADVIADLVPEDRRVLELLVEWLTTHDNLYGFYEVLVAAFAETGKVIQPAAARQRVRAIRQRIFGVTIARHRAELRASLVSIPAPSPERDPLTFAGRIAVSYLIEIAGTVSWRSTFDRIRSHLKELELDTVSPWNSADSAGDALEESLGKVTTEYRRFHGRSFWASRD